MTIIIEPNTGKRQASEIQLELRDSDWEQNRRSPAGLDPLEELQHA